MVLRFSVLVKLASFIALKSIVATSLALKLESVELASKYAPAFLFLLVCERAKSNIPSPATPIDIGIILGASILKKMWY